MPARRAPNRRATIPLLAAWSLTLPLTPGCDPQNRPSDYDVLAGTAEVARADIGQLLIRLTEASARRAKDQKIVCFVPNDAEVYINDRLSCFDEIEIGDQVELIGRFDRALQEERFVVASAHIRHNQPPAPPLDLTPPNPATSQPGRS